MRGCERAILGTLIALALLPAAERAAAAAPAGALQMPRASLDSTAEGAVAAKSGLPYPATAEVWVDLVGADPVGVPAPTVPGRPPAVVRRQAVLVFQPAGEELKWEELLALCIARGLLPPNPTLLLNVATPGTLNSPAANARDTRVYRARAGGDFLVLGLVRNLRSRNQLVYAVLLSGKLDALQALLYAGNLAETLAEEARRLRLRPPAPPGAVPAMPERRLGTPALLQELQQSIVRSPSVSPRVKEMARRMIPQATAVTLYAWRTRAPMTDGEFIAFYTREAARLGWGAPISRDETQPGAPALLFHRPAGDGVMMVRAQSAEGTPPRGTLVFVLLMEGRFAPEK